MRTLARLFTGALLVTSAALLALVAPAAGQDGDDDTGAPPAGGSVDVIEVTGLIDPVVARFVTAALDTAEREGSVALVLQLDSPGSVLADDRFDELVERLSSSPVVVAAWVGPAGSQAGDEAAELVAAADLSGLAPESRLDTPSGRVSPSVALDRDLVDLADLEAATIGDFIVNIPGVESREIADGDETRREPITRTRFAQLPLAPQLLHTVASPPVAYLLFVLGMALILFELFTAGVGVAGVVGAGSLILGAYGLAVLPTSPVAVALLVVAMFGYGVDVQTGVPRAWTAIATVSFVAGSLLLFGDGVSLSWITLLIGVLGVGVAMLGGMPAMVRTRFSTPTIGREWMLGEEGVARGAVDPDGIVMVRDAPWRARTNRATPIAAGAPVRVAGIDGLVLEVEPLEGAAKDHRERRTAPQDVGGTPQGGSHGGERGWGHDRTQRGNVRRASASEPHDDGGRRPSPRAVMVSTRPATAVRRSSPPGPEVSGFAVGVLAQLVGLIAFVVCVGLGYYFGGRAADAHPGVFLAGLGEVLLGFVVGVVVGLAAIVFVLTRGLRPSSRDSSWRMALVLLAGIVIFGVLTLGVGFLVAGPVIGTAAEHVLTDRTSVASRWAAIASAGLAVAVAIVAHGSV